MCWHGYHRVLPGNPPPSIISKPDTVLVKNRSCAFVFSLLGIWRTYVYLCCFFLISSLLALDLRNSEWMAHVNVTNSWECGVISISSDWILFFVPLFCGRWGNYSKCRLKFDSALIRRLIDVIVTKWCNTRKTENYSFKRGIIALHLMKAMLVSLSAVSEKA